MKTIAMIMQAGVATPAEPFPADAVKIRFDGNSYLCYQLGDDIPLEGPPAAVDVTPQIISPRQARLILAAAGLLDAVNAAVASIGGVAQIEWEYATEIRRDNQLLALVARQAGLSAADLDRMFTEAAKL